MKTLQNFFRFLTEDLGVPYDIYDGTNEPFPYNLDKTSFVDWVKDKRPLPGDVILYMNADIFDSWAHAAGVTINDTFRGLWLSINLMATHLSNNHMQ